MNRTLTVFCPLGLSNRLRVLLSGLVIANASGRQFKMLWPLTPACAAPFADLFANSWPVETVDAEAVTDLPYISGWFGRLPDLLTATEPNLVIGHPGWLIRPEQFPDHDTLLTHCQTLFAELQPTPSIQQRVEAFREQHFCLTMIGVHLRRGDLLRQRPDTAYNTTQAMQAVDHVLSECPNAGILLCTDDGAVDQETGRRRTAEGVHEHFRIRYGSRVIWTTPRSLDRRTLEAIQDALVDLWLLRATDYFVGTCGSSFSEFVIYGRDLPYQMYGGASLAYQRGEQVAKMTGLKALVMKWGRRQFGHALSFAILWDYYRSLPRRILAQTIKARTPTLYQFLKSRRRQIPS